MIKSRKSQIHIEMIMSFVLFVGFITAIFLFINPLKNQQTNSLGLNLAQEKIMANISMSYSYIPLIIKDWYTIGDSCFTVTNPLPSLNSVFVQGQAGEIADSKIDSNNIYIKTLGTDRLYKLYFSDIFNRHFLTETGCSALDEAAYSFGSMSVESVVLYENLVRLNELYNQDYSSLKTSLKIQNNFDFVVYDFNRTVLLTRDSPRDFGSSTVLAREIILNIVDKDNNKKDAILSIRVA